MEFKEDRGKEQSHSYINLAWNMVALASILAALWAFHYYQPSYTDAVNGAASFRNNITMSFFLVLLPALFLARLRIRWTAVGLQIIPILLFLLYSVGGAPVAYWPASLINYSLVYRFFHEGN